MWRTLFKEKFSFSSASVGGGHLRAAEAMELALRQTAPEAAIRNIDVLTLANKTFRRIYGKGYLDFANRAPHFLGYVYDLLDRPKDKEGDFEPDRLRVTLEKLNMQPFLKLLQSETWDIVVNTHFLPAEIIGSLEILRDDIRPPGDRHDRFHDPPAMASRGLRTLLRRHR